MTTSPEIHVPGPFSHELPDGRRVALGRPAVKSDPRSARFRLARFVDRSALPSLLDKVTPPESFAPRMFANDRLGDCTIVGEANYALLAAAADNLPTPTITDDDAIARYSAVCGYRAGDPSTDRGGIELDVLNEWRRDPFGGASLVAFAQIDTGDLELLRLAIQLFKAAYVGMALPTTAQRQVGGLWDAAPGLVPGSWGGHCTIVDGFDWTLSTPEMLNATWATQQRMSVGFWQACGDEAYAPLTDQWRNVPGLKYDELEAELAQLGAVNPPGSQ